MIMGIILKHEHPLTIMGKQAVTISGAVIGAARMPALPIENKHTACLRFRLNKIFGFTAGRWTSQTAFVCSRHDAGAAIDP